MVLTAWYTSSILLPSTCMPSIPKPMALSINCFCCDSFLIKSIRLPYIPPPGLKREVIVEQSLFFGGDVFIDTNSS